MKIHKNARLTLKGRLQLATDVIKMKMPLKEAAMKYRVSEKTAGKWARRFAIEGTAGLTDRTSRPHKGARRLPLGSIQKIERLRRARLTTARIAAEVGYSRLADLETPGFVPSQRP